MDPLAQQEIYRPLLDAYLKWMRRYQHASDGTLELRCHSVAQFLRWLGPEATPGRLSGLTAERIEGFFLSYAQGMGRSARRSMQAALRTFLRFCLHQGYIHRPLDLAVPTLRTYKLATVPRGLSDIEAIAAKAVNPHTIRHTTAMHLLRSGNDINMIGYWLGHANTNTTHIYVEIDMEMKRQMLKKAGAPAMQKPLPWQKPNVLHWLNALAKGPQLCVVNN